MNVSNIAPKMEVGVKVNMFSMILEPLQIRPEPPPCQGYLWSYQSVGFYYVELISVHSNKNILGNDSNVKVEFEGILRDRSECQETTEDTGTLF